MAIAVLAAPLIAGARPAQNTVPDFTGMPVAAARQLARDIGINTFIGWSVQRPSRGHVVLQYPPAGYPVKDLTGTMALYVSTGMMATGRIAAEFRTAHSTAYCQLDTANDLDFTLVCWRPRDGMRVSVGTGVFDEPGHARREAGLRGWAPPGFRVLAGARAWRRSHITCRTRTQGIECRNPLGHGFWLGRRTGVRTF